MKVKESQNQRGGMMRTLAARIEYYLERLLEGQRGKLRIQRNEVAAFFDCAPSQISYVLQTRFTPDRGYIVESQRGGGGYVEIYKLRMGDPVKLLTNIYEALDGKVSQQQGLDIILRLEGESIITPREGLLLSNILRRETLNSFSPYQDIIRGRILKSIVESLYWTLRKEE